MQTVIFLTFSAIALATPDLKQAALRPLSGIHKRQFDLCSLVEEGPDLCARSCGPGYVQCVYYDQCFNPGKGEVCCANGGK